MRKFRYMAALFAAAISLCGLSVGVTAASASSSSSSCVDHADHGKGNLADPGDGQNHHNESNGVGNSGDPGNGRGHSCPNE